MSRRLRALGLIVLSLCSLTALMATSAQANWLESGVAITTNRNVNASAHTGIKLVMATLNFEIRCTTLKSLNIQIIGTSREGRGEARFSGCKGFQISNGAELKSCEPGTSGVIVVNGKGLLVKLATAMGVAGSLKEYILIEENGAPLSSISLPETCALAEPTNVTGSLIAECGSLSGGVFVGEECSVQRVEHLYRQGPEVLWKGVKDEEQVKDELKFGANKAKVEGIAAATLSTGELWSGDA